METRDIIVTIDGEYYVDEEALDRAYVTKKTIEQLRKVFQDD